MKWRITVIAAVVVVAALAVNALLVSRATHSAQAFDGGRVLELDGPDLNVKEFGPPGDRAVVLLHGYSASVEWWNRVAAALPDHRVVAVDLVGHGGSEARTDAESYSIDSQARAVRSALDAIGVRHAIVVGHSMGGFVALALAEQDPKRVERVAISDTPAEMSLAEMPALAGLACAPVIGQAIDRLRSVDVVTNSSLQTGFADGFAVPPLAHRSLERLTHPALCYARDQDGEPAAVDRIARLEQPVLVVWGERDVLTPTAVNVQRYRQAGLTPVVIPGSGHSPMVEAPGEFVNAITEFIQ
ncbi:alpha/beta fold hydrolase [Mycolicibacterium gadium]|uniref:Alpha/beta hydrolase n=1 Tax=Mycolicibacterium gadium TaxID=1794 RepID=A0ABT6GMK5_MYCGU|nr:alpha/beta hydrolase [Mycolicibacterium gadium]MDG5482517.1 alpha/beta hydrolase [Mycolicibacterium gadium]